MAQRFQFQVYTWQKYAPKTSKYIHKDVPGLQLFMIAPKWKQSKLHQYQNG